MRRLVPVRSLVSLTAGVLLALFLLAPGQARAKGLPFPECAIELNQGFARVAKAQDKQNAKCVKDAGRGKVGSVEGCISPPNARVTSAQAKNFRSGCYAFRPFGATDPAIGNRVAVDKEWALIYPVFGSDLDAAIIDADTDGAGAKCQADIIKQVSKCRDAKLKVFNKCMKKGLKGKSPPGLIDSAEDLRDLCLGTGTNPQPDPKGKIQKACVTKLGGKIGDKCATVDKDAAFPGCAGQDLATCVDQLVECLVCGALNAVDDLSRDCDLFDDGLPNGSCDECGNGVPEPWEECDGTDDSACPGACQSDCTCPPPPNDECTAATVISAFPFTDNTYTTKTTVAVDDPLLSCGGSGRSVWYTVTAPGNGTITADTFGSSYDTVLAALTGTCGTFTEVACNDDFSGLQSLISFAVTAGQTVLLEVTSLSGSGGNLILNVVFAP